MLSGETGHLPGIAIPAAASLVLDGAAHARSGHCEGDTPVVNFCDLGVLWSKVMVVILAGSQHPIDVAAPIRP